MDSKIIQPNEKYLWKFIDLYKFIKLLKTRELYFSCLNDFDDLYEFTSEDFILKLKEAFRIAEIPSTSRNPEIGKEVYIQKEHDFLYLLERLKTYRMDRFVNCFYASDFESLAMWQLYSGIQGVAIRFDSKSLLDYIENLYSKNLSENYSLHGNYVDYRNVINIDFYDEFANPTKPDITFSPFVKDIMYKHENEYRILITRHNSIDEKPIININNWSDIDFEIFVFADLEYWKVQTIQDLLSDYDLRKTLIESQIITKKVVEKYKNRFVEGAFKKLI